jgi:hypothetical protein
MSSEESLNTRLRPGVHGKHSKSQSNEFQEDLKRLIDMDIKNSDLRGILVSQQTSHYHFRVKKQKCRMLILMERCLSVA